MKIVIECSAIMHQQFHVSTLILKIVLVIVLRKVSSRNGLAEFVHIHVSFLVILSGFYLWSTMLLGKKQNNRIHLLLHLNLIW